MKILQNEHLKFISGGTDEADNSGGADNSENSCRRSDYELEPPLDPLPFFGFFGSFGIRIVTLVGRLL